MLQNVEHANQAKGLTEWAVPNVSLDQQTGRSSLGVSQTIQPEFQPDNHAIWASLAKHAKYVSCPATDLQHEIARGKAGRNSFRQFENQPVPGTEPEVVVLDASQLLEKRGIVAAGPYAVRTGRSFSFLGNRC